MNLLEKTLGFDPKTMKLRTEMIAGVTTFLTMSYILAVNPSILMSTGMDQGALFTATALASAIATLLLAFMAKFCTSTINGTQRIFCLYALPSNGLFVAKLARYSLDRGYCIYLDNVFQRARDDL